MKKSITEKLVDKDLEELKKNEEDIKSMKIVGGLNPHTDWRIIANLFKNYPPCKNCGRPYGNVAFGAEHWCDKGYKS